MDFYFLQSVQVNFTIGVKKLLQNHLYLLSFIALIIARRFSQVNRMSFLHEI